MSEPFRIRRSLSPDSAPVVYDSPHSGRVYPTNFDARATLEELRRGEDAYVDELLDGAPSFGVCVLDANVPRCYIDLNRAETDVDPGLLSEPWPTPLAPTEKSARGLGLIRRYVVPGVEINARLLSVAEVQERIDVVYRPYHAALDELIAETLAAHGRVWHIDWHSMKSVGNAMTPDGAVARSVDFVVSDVEGRSASPAVTACVERALRDLGYRVARNDPYKGGTIVQRVGAPAKGVHSIQVEINRALYLDEQRTEHSPGFATLAAGIDALTGILVDAARSNIVG
jgi:N-formylglutamate deformylase